METISVTRLGEVTYEDVMLDRARYPEASIVAAEIRRAVNRVRQAMPHEEATVRESCADDLRRDMATLDRAMEILARMGTPAGLSMAATLRYAPSALESAMTAVKPDPGLFADDPE